jgi:flagellar biosynthesis/type III secretory pathway protein FliH
LSRERIRLEVPVLDARPIERDASERRRGQADTLDAVVENERAKAFARGVEEGHRAERADAAGRLDAAVTALDELTERAGAELASTSVDLALEIARTILRVEIAAGNYDVERLVRESLHETGVGRGSCVVHLNPTDCARLADVRFRSGTTIEPDDGVPLGDVQVETSLGLLVREGLGALESIERRLREELT